VVINTSDSTSDTSDNNEVKKTLTQLETKSEIETMWFFGLDFNKAEGINVDLTQDIKNFADNVTNSAKFGRFFKPEMTIDTKHVKRKELGKYLPPDVFKPTKATRTSKPPNSPSANSNDCDSSVTKAPATTTTMDVNNADVNHHNDVINDPIFDLNNSEIKSEECLVDSTNNGNESQNSSLTSKRPLEDLNDDQLNKSLRTSIENSSPKKVFTEQKERETTLLSQQL